jgi:hypothetical protein
MSEVKEHIISMLRKIPMKENSMCPPSHSENAPRESGVSGQQQAAMWRPIETAPNDGAYLIANDLGEVCPVQARKGIRVLSNMPGFADWTLGSNTTHWMPLPPAPSVSDGSLKGQDAKRLDPKDDSAMTEGQTPEKLRSEVERLTGLNKAIEARAAERWVSQRQAEAEVERLARDVAIHKGNADDIYAKLQAAEARLQQMTKALEPVHAALKKLNASELYIEDNNPWRIMMARDGNLLAVAEQHPEAIVGDGEWVDGQTICEIVNGVRAALSTQGSDKEESR